MYQYLFYCLYITVVATFSLTAWAAKSDQQSRETSSLTDSFFCDLDRRYKAKRNIYGYTQKLKVTFNIICEKGILTLFDFWFDLIEHLWQ